MVVAAAPCSIKDEIKLETKDDSLRKLLSTRDDGCLQSSLLDYIRSHQQDINQIDPCDLLLENHFKFNQTQWWQRDWRKTILRIGTKENAYQVYENELWERTVRWHSSGLYYLYRTKRITGSLPISDYRIELMLYEETKKAYEAFGHNFSSVEMNDCHTRSGLVVTNDFRHRVYFFADHIEVRCGEDPRKTIYWIGSGKDISYSVEDVLKELSGKLSDVSLNVIE